MRSAHFAKEIQSTGSLPRDQFSKRRIVTITYRADQLAPGLFKGGTRASGNFMKVFPGSTAGYMVRWA